MDPPVIYGDGERSRDFTYVDHAVRANVLAAESDVSGEVFNVARGGSVHQGDDEGGQDSRPHNTGDARWPSGK